jgi:putative methyltransferase (TIGR04325 family)
VKPALKNLVRPRVPAPIVRWWRHHFGWQWFRGNYAAWPGARAASPGYDDAAVLTRVAAAVREVKAGRAAWERDGVTFTTPAVNAPLLAALRQSAQTGGDRLDVVDFGGSLGSSWWQHRTALGGLDSVRWRVVEQAHYVAAGAEFAGDGLSFHASIDEALAGGPPAVILLSSVLPYLESPLDLLTDISARKFPHVIIDRTPLVRSGRARLAVQCTPPELGGGGYPCWLFSRSQLLAPLQADYGLVQEWLALDDLAPGVEHRGFYFRRKEA